MTTVAQIISRMERYYPPKLAASWDEVGLCVGSSSQGASAVVVCVDVTEAVVDYAVTTMGPHGGVIIAHHPLLLRGVKNLANSKGALIETLHRNNISLYTAHTNADAAIGGVADVFAAAIGMTVHGPIEPVDIRKPLDSWFLYVPHEHSSAVKAAVFAAGAGAIGNYDNCCWETEGTGQFRPNSAAQPYCGHKNQVHSATEVKIEFVAPRHARSGIYHALMGAHPYETPAFGVVELTDPNPITTGIGRIGTITPVSLDTLAARIKKALPSTSGGIRVAGDGKRIIEKIALCPGAGDSLLEKVRALKPDVYITADLRHHPIDEHLRAGGCATIDAGHWAMEFLWCADVARKLARDIPEIQVHVYESPTEPWTALL